MKVNNTARDSEGVSELQNNIERGRKGEEVKLTLRGMSQGLYVI